MQKPHEIPTHGAQFGSAAENADVTLVVATYNEEAFIRGCLDSILEQSYPQEKMEILVLDGLSEDGTRAILAEYAVRFPRIRLLDNPRRNQIPAYNLGLRASRGQFVLIVSAHSVLDRDYVRNCVALLQSRDVANVGGVQRAVGLTYWGSAIALAMSSPFGVGDAAFRYAGRERYVDSIFGGAWRRETLLALGGFNEELPGCEDYELNYRIRRNGGKILLSPSVRVQYFSRANLWSLARQQFRYAFQKPFAARLHPRILRWRHALPPLFLLGMMASVLLILRGYAVGWIAPWTYLALNLTFSLRIGWKSGLRYVAALPLVFATMHVSWGAGFAAGLFRAGKPHRAILGLWSGIGAGLRGILRPDATGSTR